MNRVNAPDGTPLVYDAYEPSSRAGLALLVLNDWQPQRAPATDPWAETGAQLRDQGFAAYVLDQRGHGRSGGRRGHLSRFSQLLGDLQAFRRAVRRRLDAPQVLVGHGFGGLVVLRYLETQPGEPPVAAVISSPWLAPRVRAPAWKRFAARLADLWPTLPPGQGRSYMTAGARAELLWAQRAVLADRQRIERPLLFVLGAQDPVSDPRVAKSFAESLGSAARVEWHTESTYNLVTDLIPFVVQYQS